MFQPERVDILTHPLMDGPERSHFRYRVLSAQTGHFDSKTTLEAEGRYRVPDASTQHRSQAAANAPPCSAVLAWPGQY